jgi:two-component system response regulator AlgR
MPSADAQALSVLIVDDEPLARMRLQALLEACPEPECRVAGEAADGDAALAWLDQQACDVVMLDISMPGRDGLSVAEAIASRSAPPAIVFITAHAEHALKAFDLAATDYLTKPVRRERLQAALQRVAQRRGAAPAPAAAAPTAGPDEGVLTVTDRGRTLRLPFAEIVFLKAELKYVTLHTAQRQWVLDESLSDLEQRLGPRFLRIHRNALVALDAVRALERRANDEDGAEGWAVQLSTGDWLSVSRRQVAVVRETLAAPAAAPPAGPAAAT